MKRIKELFAKNASLLIVIISAILFLTAVYEFYNVVYVQVQSNDECLWVQKKSAKVPAEIEIENVKVDGVTWNAGIRNGDYLIAINNHKVANTSIAQTILNSVKSGDFAIYTIQRGNTQFTAKVYVKKLIEIAGVADTILAIIQMLIGFVVLMAKPAGRAQKIFYAFSIASVLHSLISLLTGAILKNITPVPPSTYITGILWSIGVSFRPFLLLSFFMIFPKPFKLSERKWFRRLIMFVPIIIALIIFTLFFDIIKSPIQQNIANANIFIVYISNILDTVYLIALISLFINYKRLKNKNEKKPILFILISYSIAIAAVFYTSLIAPAISDTVFNSPQYYAPIILIILIPIGFAYSIFKYQLMDVSVVIKNTLIYGAATIGLAAIYFLVIYVLGQSISQAIGTQFQTAIAGAVFIIFALVFQSTKERFQDFLTARFYPEQFAYQKVLIKFSNDVPTIVGLDNILDLMNETYVKALKINKFAILIKDKISGNFKLVKNFGINKNDISLSGKLIDNFISNKSAILNQPVIDKDDFIKIFPNEVSILNDNNIYTIIPMIIKSKIIGLLLFGLKHSGSQFAGKDLELLSASANQAAIAIENARLYQTEAEKLRMEIDLELARKIQQGLLPKSIPPMKGLSISGEMVPALQVGGDYFDLLPVSGSKIFVVVGDVSGKGLAASLYMAKLQTMIQLSCNNEKTPKEILIELNQHFYKSIERNSFVTITLALFDTISRTVKFCRAGHMPLLEVSNNEVIAYRTQGIGVGLEKGVIFENTLIEEEVSFKEGQIFAFFSDGITEAMNESSDLFGEDKLSEVLKSNSNLQVNIIMSKVWDEIMKFRGNAEQNDDMTMVIVQVG